MAEMNGDLTSEIMNSPTAAAVRCHQLLSDAVPGRPHRRPLSPVHNTLNYTTCDAYIRATFRWTAPCVYYDVTSHRARFPWRVERRPHAVLLFVDTVTVIGYILLRYIQSNRRRTAVARDPFMHIVAIVPGGKMQKATEKVE